MHAKSLQLHQRVTAALSRLDAVQQDNLFKLLAVWPEFETAQQQAIVLFVLTFVKPTCV